MILFFCGQPTGVQWATGNPGVKVRAHSFRHSKQKKVHSTSTTYPDHEAVHRTCCCHVGIRFDIAVCTS